MKAKLELTNGAQRRAEQSGILSLLRDFSPQPNMMRGDVVEFAAPSGTESFVVYSRHFRFSADGTLVFSIKLDHPVR